MEGMVLKGKGRERRKAVEEGGIWTQLGVKGKARESILQGREIEGMMLEGREKKGRGKGRNRGSGGREIRPQMKVKGRDGRTRNAKGKKGKTLGIALKRRGRGA